jgi:hypothetical protein
MQQSISKLRHFVVQDIFGLQNKGVNFDEVNVVGAK